jgi:hypothetical protein
MSWWKGKRCLSGRWSVVLAVGMLHYSCVECLDSCDGCRICCQLPSLILLLLSWPSLVHPCMLSHIILYRLIAAWLRAFCSISFFHLDLFVQFFHASQVGLDTASSRSTNALLISRRVSLDRRFRKFASHTRIKFYNSSLLLRNISVIIYKSGSDTISGKARQLEPAQVPKPT